MDVPRYTYGPFLSALENEEGDDARRKARRCRGRQYVAPCGSDGFWFEWGWFRFCFRSLPAQIAHEELTPRGLTSLLSTACRVGLALSVWRSEEFVWA